MSALRGDDVPPGMVRISGPVPRTASVGVRSVRSQVQDACLALSLITSLDIRFVGTSQWRSAFGPPALLSSFAASNCKVFQLCSVF